MHKNLAKITYLWKEIAQYKSQKTEKTHKTSGATATCGQLGVAHSRMKKKERKKGEHQINGRDNEF